MTYSMTGFARFSQQICVAQLTYEIRALNHRFLEMTMRLPEAVQNFEPLLRAEFRKKFSRGKFDVTIKLTWHADEQHEMPIDEHMLTQLINASHRAAALMQNPAPVSPLDILRWPGVLGLEHFDQVKLWQDIEYGFNQTLMILHSVREAEGLAIKHYLEERLAKVATIVCVLAEHLPELLQAQKERLQQRFAEAQLTLPAERLAQEMLVFAQRLDISEELSRLSTHVETVRHLLNESAAHGRRLDFLMQELNREANTLGSKSLSSLQTNQVIELKVLIEQMREQVQNLE